MNYASIIYWAGVANSISATLTTLYVVGGIVLVAAAVVRFVNIHVDRDLYDREPDDKKHPIRNGFFILLATGLINSFIPDGRTIYMMVGAQMVQDLSVNPRAQALGDRVVRLIEGKLDEQIEHLNPPTQESEDDNGNSGSTRQR